MPTNDFGHLTIPYTPKSNQTCTNNGVENKKMVAIQKIITGNRYLHSILKKMGTLYLVCENFINSELQNKRTISLLEESKDESQRFGSGFGYADDLAELMVTLKYQKQIEAGLDNIPSESGKLYTHLESILSEILTNHNDCLLNFGVSYAYIDSILALKHPTCNFIGIDRSSYTKLHNENCFGHIQNLEFLSGDIFELLKKRKFENGIFFTTRTLCLLPKIFIQRLYKAVADAGFCYIVGVEQIGISRQTKEPYQFSALDQPSILFRGPMYIHNYPALVKEAGFEIAETALIKTGHPHPDFRFLSFIASKNK